MEPQQINTDACNGFEVGWGITPDGRRILLVTATQDGGAVGCPLGLSVELAGSLVMRLQRYIALAEAWKAS